MRRGSAKQTRKVRRIEDDDYRQLAEFRHAMRIFLEFSERAARAAGITPQQHQALLAIKGLALTGEAGVGALAERLRIRHHSAVELVNRLCDAKLVHRESDPRDRRRVSVALTAKAGRILEGLSATHLEELQRLRPALQSILALMDAGPVQATNSNKHR
jgi:DNA-binding MarR family transcriptional regulator